MYKPKHLERWYERVNYTGENFDDFYVAAWRLFRCTPVERSNFAYIKSMVSGSFEDPQTAREDGILVHATFTDEVYLARYYVLVHHTCDRALRMADMLAERVSRKGSLDPESEKSMDINSVRKTWKRSELLARIRLCSEAGVSIFASRHDTLPDGDVGRKIFELLSESDHE
jgi:hypothetical protein